LDVLKRGRWNPFADPNGPRGQALLAALQDGDYSTVANGGW
jgi:hypothetical protein